MAERDRAIAERDALIEERTHTFDVLAATRRERDELIEERARTIDMLAATRRERDKLSAQIAAEVSRNAAVARLGLRPRPSRIFFMHIAKTAGSYVNDMFIRSLGAENCAEHAERFLHNPALFRRAIEGKLFVSGHIYYHDWMRLMGEADRQFLKITFLREPLEHIVSHLQFVEHFSRPELKNPYDNMLSAEVCGVVDHLARVDFSCSEAVVQMLRTLSPAGVELFDNCQSRYFLAGGEHVARISDPLGPHLRRPLLDTLQKFDIVGTTSTILPCLREVGALLGVELHLHEEVVNATPSPKRIDRSAPAVMRALRERTLLDEVLYQALSGSVPKPAERTPHPKYEAHRLI